MTHDPIPIRHGPGAIRSAFSLLPKKFSSLIGRVQSLRLALPW